MAFHKAVAQRERDVRANFIEDAATAVWGGKAATDTVRKLRSGK